MTSRLRLSLKLISSVLFVLLIIAGWQIKTFQLVLYAAPVVVNLGLARLFGRTLVAGQTPLISRFVELKYRATGVPDPSVWPYARRLTMLWTLLFVANALICLVLALLASPDGILDMLEANGTLQLPRHYWIWYASFGCYLTSIVLFVLEFIYRGRRFPWKEKENIIEFTRLVINAARNDGLLSDKPTPSTRN